MTHDDKRHGTTSLFAALDVATGAVIGHRHQEFLRFLRTIDRQTPKKRDLHLVLTTTLRTSIPTLRHGWPNTHAFICTSRRPRPPGSIRWGAPSA
jgi:hypothetical protein